MKGYHPLLRLRPAMVLDRPIVISANPPQFVPNEWSTPPIASLT